jgi:dihydroorotate dehydrogenase (NAD+) catalytic subunit
VGLKRKTNLAVSIGGVTIKNPIISASGTYGYGEEFQELYDISKLGGVCTKGLSLKPRQGNPMPRIVETPSGMLNSIGLQNVGIDKFIEEKLPFLRSKNAFVIANIFGETQEDYVELAGRLSLAEGIDVLELNISCPNVKKGGMQFGVDYKLSSQLVRAIKEVCSLPLMVKLSPNVASIPEMAKALEGAGADSLSVINTIPGMEVNISERKPVLAQITGGLSGPAIRPIALRMVWEAVNAVSIPVIGIGGIMNVEDVLRFLIVGARAVQIGTANFVDPYICVRLIDQLEDYLVRHEINDVNDLIGTLGTR